MQKARQEDEFQIFFFFLKKKEALYKIKASVWHFRLNIFW